MSFLLWVLHVIYIVSLCSNVSMCPFCILLSPVSGRRQPQCDRHLGGGGGGLCQIFHFQIVINIKPDTKIRVCVGGGGVSDVPLSRGRSVNVQYFTHYFGHHWETWGECRRKSDRRHQLPLADLYHQKRRIRQQYLAVARLLLPTPNLLLPSTVYVWRCKQLDCVWHQDVWVSG